MKLRDEALYHVDSHRLNNSLLFGDISGVT